MFWDAWPGKTSRDDDEVEYPAVLHMLDVAAVTEILLEDFDMPEPLRDACVLLIALHDLGKISESFRAMVRDGKPQKYRHWELTEVLLRREDKVLSEQLGSEPFRRQMIYAAVAGHHGRPSALPLDEIGGAASKSSFRGGARPSGISRDTTAQIGEGWMAAQETIQSFLRLWPKASLQRISLEQATVLSWWLPGLCSVADWIGSNSAWFPLHTTALSLEDHLTASRSIAREALKEAGLKAPLLKEGSLFEFSLRPMQQAVSEVALPDGPSLVIIEDETGAGKTEAALLLAQRMLAAKKGKGLYFALPTMATADAMFLRARAIVGAMFVRPSLTLAHGRSALSSAFRDIQLHRQAGPLAEAEEGPSCSEWLSSGTRRALLANIGIGTIDQALTAVLPVKFQTMRYFGLSSKIMIVDEVHEMGEAYIAEELVALLKMHRAAGGSAILLTATLPLKLRAKLLATYDAHSDNPAYPAMTVAGGACVTEFSADLRPKKGPVKIERLGQSAQAISLICEKAAQGAACVWVRNAVDDAIAAVEALRASGVEAQLLHARFTLADRKRIEAQVAAHVGKHGKNRAGFVLVGTQVLESSLDYDFDVMVSDIAPVAAIIQRAGRLWRHMEERPADLRPVPEPILYVLSPDPNDVVDNKWLQRCLERGAFTYPQSDIWRSAIALFSRGAIHAPDGLRTLIEEVHGRNAEPVPEALLQDELENEGRDAAKATHAHHNIIAFDNGYRMAGGGMKDTKYPTRLGQDTQTLLLVRPGSEGLEPWGSGENAWQLSEVSVRINWLRGITLPSQDMPEVIKLTADWPEWRRREVQVCIVDDSGTICDGLQYDAKIGLSKTS